MKTTSARVLSLSVLALVACLYVAPIHAQVYIEDFEHDVLGNTAAGFDTVIFTHLFTGPNSFLSDDLAFPALDQPSLHHELFLGAGTGGVGATTDFVTFLLGPGQTVNYAGVWMTGTGGGAAAVTFHGVNGNLEFQTTKQDDYDLFDTTGSLIGDILAITLNIPLLPDPPGPGPEALYDDIIINVVPEPSSLVLAATALAGLAGFLRRRRR